MSRPIAVLISDIHFNLKNLQLASYSLSNALSYAEKINVPLIIAGDLHDSKAILRGECVSKIIDILKGSKVKVKVLIGNHDKIHEKSDDHALEFLRPYVDLIDKPRPLDLDCGLGFIPYQSTNEKFISLLNMFVIGQTIICHQGFKGAFMGEYIKDESSVDVEEVENFNIISGHYHRHQKIGTVTYIGTPYTVTFTEANDGQKGFLVLNDDNTITKVSLDLRKHVIIERHIDDIYIDTNINVDKDDLIWLKITGPAIELDKLNKKYIGLKLFGHDNFKLDLIPETSSVTIDDIESLSNSDILNKLIDSDTTICETNKVALKNLYKELLDEIR